jgi:hypothetical protein
MNMAKLNQGNRSNARQAASGADTGASTGRSPSPRAEGDQGTDANAAAAPAAPPSSVIVIIPEAKRKNTLAAKHYAMYGPHHVLTNVDDCKTRGVRGKDLTWDTERGFILIGEEADKFPLQGSNEEKLAYLRTQTEAGKAGAYTDKLMIKIGFMEAPKVEEQAAAPAEAATA